MILNGNKIRVASYGRSRALVHAYQFVNSGWEQIPQSAVWKRKFWGGKAEIRIVGNVIDRDSVTESPVGDVLNWTDLQIDSKRKIDKLTPFVDNPKDYLKKGHYAFDWKANEMYVRLDDNPNNRRLGIACVGRFINTEGDVRNVEVTNLRLLGFTRAGMNIRGNSGEWKVHNNEFYGIGGNYNKNSEWYFGSGVQMTQSADNVEVYRNTFVDTYDSPITPQHYGGSDDDWLEDLHFHSNYIDRFALGGIELADFGTDNRFKNIMIENNVIVNAGEGFSSSGDAPQGINDAIHVTGGANGGKFWNLTIKNNDLDGNDAAINLKGNDYRTPVIIFGNQIRNSKIGLHHSGNQAPNAKVEGNWFCQNEQNVVGNNYSVINTNYFTNSCSE